MYFQNVCWERKIIQKNEEMNQNLFLRKLIKSFKAVGCIIIIITTIIIQTKHTYLRMWHLVSCTPSILCLKPRREIHFVSPDHHLHRHYRFISMAIAIQLRLVWLLSFHSQSLWRRERLMRHLLLPQLKNENQD